jgi:hypothetical protein
LWWFGGATTRCFSTHVLEARAVISIVIIVVVVSAHHGSTLFLEARAVIPIVVVVSIRHGCSGYATRYSLFERFDLGVRIRRLDWATSWCLQQSQSQI